VKYLIVYGASLHVQS